MRSLAWHLGTQLLFGRGCLIHVVCVCVATGALHLWTQLLLSGAVRSNGMSEDVRKHVKRYVRKNVKRHVKKLSERMSEHMSERISEDMSESMSKDMSERVSEDMSERMSKDMSERMSKDMSESCQKEFENICQKEFQKICQKAYQMICQKECQKICQKKRKKIVSSHSAKFKVTESISGDEWYVCPHLTRSSDTKSKKPAKRQKVAVARLFHPTAGFFSTPAVPTHTPTLRARAPKLAVRAPPILRTPFSPIHLLLASILDTALLLCVLGVIPFSLSSFFICK